MIYFPNFTVSWIPGLNDTSMLPSSSSPQAAVNSNWKVPNNTAKENGIGIHLQLDWHPTGGW